MLARSLLVLQRHVLQRGIPLAVVQGQRTIANVPFAACSRKARFTGNRSLLVVAAARNRGRQESGSAGSDQDSSSGSGAKSSHHWPHASIAASSGFVLVASSAEDLKAEAAAGDQLIDLMGPALAQLSMGSVLGYATGYALRVVGRMAAFGVGSIFLCLQMAAYKGYVDVNWAKIVQDTKGGLLDVDSDGDFDVDDAKLLMRKFLDVCTYNLPSGAGFTGGLALGLGFTGGSAGKAALAVGTVTAIPRTIALVGSAATAGPGVLISLQEYLGGSTPGNSSYDAVDKAKDAVREARDSETFFLASLTGLDLNGLRAQEKELRDRLSSLGGCAQKDKDLLARRIAYIENLKAEIKKK